MDNEITPGASCPAALADYPFFAAALEIEVLEKREGYAKVVMPLTRGHRNLMGTAHGGAIFSLADACFGYASGAPDKLGHVTAGASISYLAPGSVGPLTAECECVHGGQNIGTWDVRITDGNGKLIAVCRITSSARRTRTIE